MFDAQASVAVIGALAIGLPIVATNVGGLAEELDNGVDSLLVPPGDAVALAAGLERVATDRKLSDRLAAASAARAPEFGVTRTVSEIEATYERVARPVSVGVDSATPDLPKRTRQ